MCTWSPLLAFMKSRCQPISGVGPFSEKGDLPVVGRGHSVYRSELEVFFMVLRMMRGLVLLLSKRTYGCHPQKLLLSNPPIVYPRLLLSLEVAGVYYESPLPGFTCVCFCFAYGMLPGGFQ